MIDFAHAVASAVVPTASANNTTAILATFLAIAAGVTAMALARLRNQQRSVADIQRALQSVEASLASLQERERKLQAELEMRRDEAKGLKQDIGAQRKKNHATQEEMRKLRDALRDQTRLRVEAQNSRPAFADVPEPKPKAPEPKVMAPPPPPPPIIEAPKVDLQMVSKLKRVEAQVQELQTKMAEERTAASGVKEEFKKLRKRSEDLRRIDIITKSKMGLLEDKLRTLGRQYYEAISELAARKGEVVPPRPRDMPVERDPEPFLAADDETEDDKTEDDNEGLSNASSNNEASSMANV